MADHDVVRSVAVQNLVDGFGQAVLRALRESAEPQRPFFIRRHAVLQLRKVVELGPDRLVDLPNTFSGVLRADAAMQEYDVIDFDDGVVLPQPFSVLALG